jgi:oligo-1,6-glucosidase
MLAVLLLGLRGTPYIYQGQEIGMTNFDFKSMDEIRDVESENIYRLAKKLHIPAKYRWSMIKRTGRDNSRTPIQWSSEPNGGFSSSSPWLGVNRNYMYINADKQSADDRSILSFYKRMISFRAGSEILRRGSFRPLHISRSVFAFERTLKGHTLIVMVNFSPKPQRVPYIGNIAISNYDEPVFSGILKPWEGVIIE